MTKTAKFSAACLLMMAAPMAFACDYPERPTIPDGSTASKEEMITAKNDITAWMTGVDDYLTCIETAEKEAVQAMEDADPADLERRDAMLSKKFDAANEQKVLLGEEFNQQVRAYNAARSSD
ncbi:MAG: hypothetical protein AAF351_02755 [Pseudomonadota bacterium]